MLSGATAIATRDGGLALVGVADSCRYPAGNRSCWVVVTDGDGNVRWESCYIPDSTAFIVSCRSVVQLADGRLVLAGYYASHFYPFDSVYQTNSCRLIWLMCLAETGDKLWSKIYSVDTTHHYADVGALAACQDGGFVLTGYVGRPQISRSHQPNADGWILKADSIGQLEWLRTYGGPYWDALCDVTPLPSGRMAVVGEKFSSAQENARPDGWIVEINAMGDVLLDRIIQTEPALTLYSVRFAPDGGIVVRGDLRERPNPRKYNILLMKLTESGDSLWSSQYGDNHGDRGSPIFVQGQGYVFMVNQWFSEDSSHRELIIKTDLHGNEIWSRFVAGCPESRGVSDIYPVPGGYFFTGAVEGPCDSSPMMFRNNEPALGGH